MKILKILIPLFMINLILPEMHAQVRDSVYEKAMYIALENLDSAKNADDLNRARTQFERISFKYTSEWLPLYYMAYVDIQSVYYDPRSVGNDGKLENAKSVLEKLDLFKNADMSEINTLWGYFYNGIIMLNPSVNGQKYYHQVLDYYKIATDMNPNNPRPIFLSAFFESNLPSFLHSGKNICDQYSQAENLHIGFSQNIDSPYWGKAFLKYLIGKCQ